MRQTDMRISQRATTATLGVAVAAVVVGIVVAARVLAGGGSAPSVRPQHGDRPPLLHLARNDVAGPAASPGGTGPGGSPYRLAGPLPSGRLHPMPVWRLRHATAADAADVAAALGLSGTPTRVDGGWVLRAGPDRLVVSDEGSWSWGMDCMPGQPVTAERIDVMCASASATAGDGRATGPSPAPPTRQPSQRAVRDATHRLLDRLGLTDVDLRVAATDGQASPRLDGLRTTGWDATFEWDAGLRLRTANGWLTAPSRGPGYPLVSARRAFDLLQQRPRPMSALCIRRPDGKPGCAPTPPTVITGATLGFTLDYDGSRPVLVPAWLFTVQGDDQPLPQVAVASDFLAPTATPSVKPRVGGPGTQPQPAPSRQRASRS